MSGDQGFLAFTREATRILRRKNSRRNKKSVAEVNLERLEKLARKEARRNKRRGKPKGA